MPHRETKDMMSAQAKASVDTTKEVQSDPSLKTKADKDRRLREKSQANAKRFVDERRNCAMRQGRRREKQNGVFVTQLEAILQYPKDVSRAEMVMATLTGLFLQTVEMCVNEEIEYQLANKIESCV